MAIVPTWRNRPPTASKQNPARAIFLALHDRDNARTAVNEAEQKLAAVVAQQPRHYRAAFNTFRAAGGSTAEQWQEWQHNGGGLRWRHLRLVYSD